MIKDPRLALNLNDNGPITRIRGSVPGCIEVRSHGSLGDMGAGPVSTSFTRSLISESAALAAGYHVIHDTRIANEYHLVKEGRPPLVFKINRDGTYSMPIKEFMAHFPMSYDSSSYATDVERSQIVFTKSQRERADLYRRHHCTVLGHAHDDRVIGAIENGSITDVPYTAADIKHAAIILGPCTECQRAKGTKHRKTGHYPRQPTSPGELLTGDLFQIMGVVFFMLTCRMVNLRIVIRLKNKSASQIMEAVSSSLNIWKGFGAKPKSIAWDQEPAIVACIPEIWAKHGVKVELVPPDSHEKVAERNVRTIKEHTYATILSLGHAIDDIMLEGLVRDTVTMLNYLPTTEVDRSSPRTILDGERLNVARWSRFAAGQVGEFEIPYPDRSAGARKELGYVLCHQGDNAIVRLLPSGKRAVVRSAHFTSLHKTPAIIKLIEDGISAAHKQSYADLVADIGEFYAHPSSELQVLQEIPQASEKAENTRPMEPRQLDEDINFFGSPPTTDSAITPHPPPAPQDHSTIAADAEASPQQEITVPDMPPLPETSPATKIAVLPSQPPGSPVKPSQGATVPTTQSVAPLVQSPVSQVRRSQRAAAHKPKGFYKSLGGHLTEAESVRDYTACHMSAKECAEIYGKDAQVAAGAEEIINILGRDSLRPVDYRELTEEDMERVLPSFMFYKAKELLPSEIENPDKASKTWTTVLSKRDKKALIKMTHKIKGRLVGGGNHQEKHEALRDRVAPTARSTTHAIVITIAAKEKRPLRVGDIPSAYLQAKYVSADGKPTYVRADKETTSIIVRVYPDLANYVTPRGTMILEVTKALYGLVESASLWYEELAGTLGSMGYEVVDADRGLFVKKVVIGGKIVASNIVSVHVDDLISAASPNSEGTKLSHEFWSTLEAKWPGIKHQTGPRYRHLSWDITQDPKTGVILRSQSSFLRDMLKTLKIGKMENYPMRPNLLSYKPEASKLDDDKHAAYRSILQKVAYAREGRPDIDFVVAYLQRQQTAPTERMRADILTKPLRGNVFRDHDTAIREGGEMDAVTR